MERLISSAPAARPVLRTYGGDAKQRQHTSNRIIREDGFAPLQSKPTKFRVGCIPHSSHHHCQSKRLSLKTCTCLSTISNASCWGKNFFFLNITQRCVTKGTAGTNELILHVKPFFFVFVVLAHTFLTFYKIPSIGELISTQFWKKEFNIQ